MAVKASWHRNYATVTLCIVVYGLFTRYNALGVGKGTEILLCCVVIGEGYLSQCYNAIG